MLVVDERMVGVRMRERERERFLRDDEKSVG